MKQKKPHRIPSYRLYRRTNQAVVTLGGEDHYMGAYGSPESRQKYDRLIAEWIANGRQKPVASHQITVVEVIARFWTHAEQFYRKPDGTPTTTLGNLRIALRPLKTLYGDTLAVDFGPRALRALRQWMVDRGWCRNNVNQQVGRIKAVFKWAASVELIPASSHHALVTVAGLKRGRGVAPDAEPVRPVPEAHMEAVRPFVSRQVWAMIQLQLLTAARPGEIVGLRSIDLDTTGRIWLAKVRDHKTAHHGHERALYLGPRAQEVVRPFLTGRRTDAPLFSPADADAERRAALTAARKTPLSCGNAPGDNRVAKPERAPGDRYDVNAYRRAIARGCDQAFPPPAPLDRERGETIGRWRARLTPEQAAELKKWQADHRWHPHQLRHNAATHLRREFGLEVARAVLGHRSASVTEIYAELDSAKALEVMGKIG